MIQLVLAAAVLTVAASVYGAIGLRWRRRARIRREILELIAALDFEPYHAAALKSGVTEAAAAELLLGGYLDIDGEGAVLLTEAGRTRGRTPVHPVPAALLEAVRRHDPEPVSIGWVDCHDEEYQARRGAYRRECDARLPEIPRMPDGEGRQLLACCACVGVVLLLVFWVWAAMLLVMARPNGVLEWVAATGAALGLAVLWFADGANKQVGARTACDDPLGDRLLDECHPAVAALDEQQRLHVLESVEDRSRWRGVDRVVDEDGDGDDDWDDDWCADAYHYRAADHDDEPDGEAGDIGVR
ncbi:hypothetical protein GCM10010230_24200 [Streptomyces narbonensis]|uniref:hypothetical protein n=1 Tax=Streptomyces narbonensis TaxID=67333 RepID=UPI0016742B99|nr:hypothetical protein [Streptomyces narbonensis]GGV99056.1 hypothetical protein GCM10010230_24200 [Streptomyces narbonensis]